MSPGPKSVDTSLENDFFAQVYALVRCIPPGRVTSYGALARYLGVASSARTVGWALNLVHKKALQDVPAHRVVNRLGVLSGKHHFGEPGRMQALLEAEGVAIQDDQVMDFDRLFWDPQHELDAQHQAFGWRAS